MLRRLLVVTLVVVALPAPASRAQAPDPLHQRVLGELREFTDWLKRYGVDGYIGEVGWPDDGRGDSAQWNALAEAWFMEADAAGLWVHYWATGEWWGTKYLLAAYEDRDPARGVDAPNSQAPILEAHLEPNFDSSRYEHELEAIVRPLRETGALVLMATFPDITQFSPLPARFTRGIRARLGDASAAVRRVAARHDALLLDADEFPEAKEREIISVDRLHPGPWGHVLLAQTFARLLEEHGGVPVPQPEGGDVAGKLAQARWLLRQFKPAEVAQFVYRFYLAPRRRTSP